MYRNLFKLTLLAALVGVLDSGCASHPAPKVEVTDVPPGSFVTTWSTPVSLASVSQLYLEGNQLFAYGPKNMVANFDGKGGLKFLAQVGSVGDVLGPPMVQADRYIIPTSNTLEILTPRGFLQKSVTLQQPLRSPGVVIDQTVYAGSDSDTGGRLAAIALDKPYNIYRWTVLTEGSIVHTRPAVHDNVVYAATENGQIIAVNPDRSQLWPVAPEMPKGIFRTDGGIRSAIKVDDAGVYVASTDTKLYALEPNTGRIRWQYFAGVALDQSPVPTADTVYLFVQGKGLVAIDKKLVAASHPAKWTFADGKQLLADDAKYAYVLTTGGRVVAIEKSSGQVKFQTNRSDITMAVTHVDAKDATIFALTRDNTLVAITPVLKTGVIGQIALAD